MTKTKAMLDEKLLLNIFQIGSMSQIEFEMVEYICNFLDAHGIPYNRDKFGNVWDISHKERPLLSAHTDTVQDSDDYSLAHLAKIQGNILRSYGVLGGDDKAGIYSILHILREIPDVNFVFFVEEEIGGMNGSTFWVKNHYQELEENVIWSIVIDRRGEGDILCYDHFGTYGTKEFQQALLNVGERYGFKSANGSISDADKLKYHVSSANVSAGYYNPHSKDEYVFLPDLRNAIDFLTSCINEITDTFKAPDDSLFFDDYSYMFDDGYLFEEIGEKEANELLEEIDEENYSGTHIREAGETKYFVEALNDFYTSKELDEVMTEIVYIFEKNGRMI